MVTDTTVPIVVDLDRTLTPTDTLQESLVRLVQEHPARLLWLPAWLPRDRARFKRQVSAHMSLPPEALPWQPVLVEHLRTARARGRGRRIVLATAADESIAQHAAEHLGSCYDVIASDGRSDFKGDHKLRAIRERVGEHFVYAGDSRADLPIWRAASGAILVGVSRHVRGQVQACGIAVEAEFAPLGWRG